MKNLLFVGVFALLAVGAGYAEGTLTVGAGETYTVSGSESYDTIDLLGEMRLTKVSSSAGALGATNGTLTVAADWPNAAAIEVSEKGTVAVAGGARVGGMLKEIALSGTGGLVNDSGRKLKTAKLTLVDPVSGDEHVYEDGLFDASNSFGLIKSGSVQVGTPGAILIVL